MAAVSAFDRLMATSLPSAAPKHRPKLDELRSDTTLTHLAKRLSLAPSKGARHRFDVAPGNDYITIAPGIYHFPKALTADAQESLVWQCDNDVMQWSDTEPKYPAKLQPVSTLGFTSMYAVGAGRRWSYGSDTKRLHDTGDCAALPASFAKAYATMINACPFFFPESLECTMAYVNYYPREWGKLGWHSDRDASRKSTVRGDPVVSFSVGDTANFDFAIPRALDEAKLGLSNGLTCLNQPVTRTVRVRLKSGDALVFGGPARQVRHRVASIDARTSTAPMVAGRLNVTLRSWG